jgi:aryl-alcohol dehydrogenase-like predicted oxidoreductase
MVSSSEIIHEIQQTNCSIGCNFFDTAEVYANGQSEIEMG